MTVTPRSDCHLDTPLHLAGHDEKRLHLESFILRAVAVEAPEWIRSFGGSRLIVQDEAAGVYWNQDAGQAAQIAQSLAEGQEVRMQRKTRSAWIYVVYVFAALFALQFLFFLLAFGISLISGF